NPAIRIDTRRNLVHKRLQKSGVSFPPEVHVAGLNFRNDGFRRHCAELLYPPRRFRPATHSGVGKDEFADGIWIFLIESRHPFVLFEPFFPLTLPPLNCRTQTNNVSVAWR